MGAVARGAADDTAWRENGRMNASSNPMGAGALARQGFHIPLTREFLTVVLSTAALIVLCRLFAPSSIAYGTLAGSLPFAAILVIVGLGQMLVVQQGGFDLSQIQTHSFPLDNAVNALEQGKKLTEAVKVTLEIA